MNYIRHIVITELSYHRTLLLIGFAGVALVYGLMSTDRLAYTLLLGYMVAYGALVLMFSQVKEKREKQFSLLPASPWVLFVARALTPLLFCAGTVLLIWLLMLRPAYQALHAVLTWRMLGAFLVMAFYFVAAFSLADVKQEKQLNFRRFIYPGLALAFWFALYMLFILDWSEETEAMGTGISPVARVIFETPGGIALLIAIISVMLFINWRLYQRRTTFIGK